MCYQHSRKLQISIKYACGMARAKSVLTRKYLRKKEGFHSRCKVQEAKTMEVGLCTGFALYSQFVVSTSIGLRCGKAKQCAW